MHTHELEQVALGYEAKIADAIGGYATKLADKEAELIEMGRIRREYEDILAAKDEECARIVQEKDFVFSQLKQDLEVTRSEAGLSLSRQVWLSLSIYIYDILYMYTNMYYYINFNTISIAINTHTHSQKRTYIHRHIHTHTHTHKNDKQKLYLLTRPHTHTHVYTHVYVYSYTRTHTRMQTRAQSTGVACVYIHT